MLGGDKLIFIVVDNCSIYICTRMDNLDQPDVIFCIRKFFFARGMRRKGKGLRCIGLNTKFSLGGGRYFALTQISN